MKKEILIIGFLIGLSMLLISCDDGRSDDNIVAEDSSYVKIPLSEVSNKIQFYDYDDRGLKISYFAVLGSDNQPRIAFNACDVCGGKGYQQVGNDIRCNNCGRVFSIDGLGTKNQGYGCWPSYLQHKVQESNIFINIDDLKSGSYRFA